MLKTLTKMHTLESDSLRQKQPTFVVCHEFKALLAKVDGEATTTLLTNVGDTRHVKHILCKLIL